MELKNDDKVFVLQSSTDKNTYFIGIAREAYEGQHIMLNNIQKSRRCTSLSTVIEGYVFAINDLCLSEVYLRRQKFFPPNKYVSCQDVTDLYNANLKKIKGQQQQTI